MISKLIFNYCKIVKKLLHKPTWNITYSSTGFIVEEEMQKNCKTEDGGKTYKCDGTKKSDEEKLNNLPWARNPENIEKYV